jgi:hypothetical protein
MARKVVKSEAADSLVAALNRAHLDGERTVIKRHGKEIAAVVSINDLRTLEILEDQVDLEDARRIMKKPGRLISWEKIKADLNL